MSLPVNDILPALRDALAANAPVALVAPPGAGKTTAIAPALLGESWAAGRRILLLSPRRARRGGGRNDRISHPNGQQGVRRHPDRGGHRRHLHAHAGRRA
jgi:hypothetical protein